MGHKVQNPTLDHCFYMFLNITFHMFFRISSDPFYAAYESDFFIPTRYIWRCMIPPSERVPSLKKPNIGHNSEILYISSSGWSILCIASIIMYFRRICILDAMYSRQHKSDV